MSSDMAIHGACMKHSAHERAISAHDARLDSHSDSIDGLKDCITRLTALQEESAKWQKDADERIRNLEAVPATRWNTSINTLVTSIVSAIAGAGIAAIGIKMIAG